MCRRRLGCDALRPAGRSCAGRRSSSSTASWSTGRSGATAPTSGPTTPPSTCTAWPRSAATARRARLCALKQNRYDRCESTHARPHGVARRRRCQAQQGEWVEYFRGKTPRPGSAGRVHRGAGRARGPRRLLRLGDLGDASPTAPARTTRTRTTGPTSRWSATGPRLHVPLECVEPDHAAGRHRRDPLLLRQVRLSRLGRRRTPPHTTTLRSSLEAHAESAGHGVVLRCRRRRSSSSSARRRRPRPLSRRARSLLWLRSRAFLPFNLLRTWHLQLAIFWIATAWVAGGLFLAPLVGGARARRAAPGRQPPVRRARRRRARQPARRGARDQRPARRASGSGSATRAAEYLDLGRLWQLLLAAGLVLWLVAHVPGAAAGDEGGRALRARVALPVLRRRRSRSSTCRRSSTARTPTSP